MIVEFHRSSLQIRLCLLPAAEHVAVLLELVLEVADQVVVVTFTVLAEGFEKHPFLDAGDGNGGETEYTQSVSRLLEKLCKSEEEWEMC